MLKPIILHLEATNFINKPVGGQLNFSRQLLKVLGTRLALVGWSISPSDPVGCWFDKEIDGTIFRYFAIGHERPSAHKSLIPSRMITWLQIKWYQKAIFSIGIQNIIIREHSILMAITPKKKYNICYYFPGVDAPLSISRYPIVKHLSGVFDYLFFLSLSRKANYILAAADESAIIGILEKVGKKLKRKKIISFPTRVDTSIFHPGPRLLARKELCLPHDATIVVTTGRIHWAKGWSFLLESFKLFHDRFPRSLLIFVGNGAEQELLEHYASTLGLEKRILLAGYQSPSAIAVYLQAANLFVMGSIKEGWSTALVEALACHLPIVTTRFSSAASIVRDGVNGFVVDRNPQEFSKAMESALSLCDATKFSERAIHRYSIKNLEHDLFRVWPLI